MKESTTAAGVPRYVELAPAASMPGAGTAGALLRDYLAILAFHFELPGADRSATAVSAAIGNLPGLLMQGTLQAHKDVTVTAGNAADGLAGILANEWGAAAGSPGLLSLTQPMITDLGGGDDSRSAQVSFEVTLIVLQRPGSGAPTLGSTTLSLTLRQAEVPITQPDAPAAQPPAPSRSLLVGCSRTSFTVLNEQIASSQDFVTDLTRQGLIADLDTTPGYIEIPLG
jgi:hypothetical protein